MSSQSALTMCERCDGLCCRVYDIFDHASEKIVKRAWVKCGYLDIKNRCRIHATRSKHLWYRDSCDSYDCMEGGPIVTIFARRIPDEYDNKHAITSSLLETIRLRIEETPSDRDAILDFVAKLLNNVKIDDSLMISVKVVRVKIERWEK